MSPWRPFAHRGVLMAMVGLAATSAGVAAEPVAAAPTAAEASTAPIEYDGQTFALANTARNECVETDEYTVAGEKISSWTQLVTVQRLTLAKPTDAEAFVGFFKQQVGQDGATLEVLAHSPIASVFAVRFPKSDRNDEQVMICLAFTKPGTATELNIVQYAIKPTRLPVELTAARIKAWRDKFLNEAEALRRP